MYQELNQGNARLAKLNIKGIYSNKHYIFGALIYIYVRIYTRMNNFSLGKNIYSVDMMITYLKLYKHRREKALVGDYLHALEGKNWGDVESPISPIDVLKAPNNYSAEYSRITRADLKYPIIIHKGNVVDGLHRLAKAKLEGKEHVQIYTFEANLMRKFLLNKEEDWAKVDQMPVHELMTLFCARFGL